MMHHYRRVAIVAACLTAFLLASRRAEAQGFVGVSYGYNFAGDAGCRSATDCQNKNWNWGGSLGALGPIVGFEAEVTHEGKFTGDRVNPTSVTTLMGNFMLAPRITIVQPYGLVGLGAIKTAATGAVSSSSNSETQIGWTIGGGVIVYVQKHVGLKGEVRYYHSFQALDLLGVDIGGDKVDFGRAGFGVVLKF